MIVLDASLVIAWLFGRVGSQASPHLEELLVDVSIVVPSHWPLEIANFVTSGLRRGSLTVDHVHFMLSKLDRLDIGIEPTMDLDTIGPVAAFAAHHELTSCEAAYVKLAMQREAALGTLDSAMRRAAQRLNIPLIPAWTCA
ncbi:MAG: type II toxin-antitoxin system VapC family toxin [Pseudorhodoplanes sp.]|nr:type II toxin-antitoxin system VapC family toxin [Pseudorhodoplanes sp.]